MFVIDTSTSVSSEFGVSAAIDETLNFVRRALNNVNVHPQATRLARDGVNMSENCMLQCCDDFLRGTSTR